MTIASTTPAAQSDDPVLDELIGTATNTALLPEPDAHAYDDIATGDADPLVLGALRPEPHQGDHRERRHADRDDGVASLPHDREQPARLHPQGHHDAAEHVRRA